MSHFKVILVPVAFVLLGIFCWTPGTARATNFTFTGLASTCPGPDCSKFVPGDPSAWGDARNWSPQGVPGPSDTATINIGTTVNIGGTRSVQRLTLGNGSQFGTALQNGTLTLTGHAASGASSWKSGNIACTFNIASGAKLVISGNTNRALVGATMNNSGTVTWLDDGSISCVGSPTFNNLSGGVFNAQSNAQWAPNAGTTIFRNKAGAIFNKSGAGTQTAFSLVDFSNAGTVNGLSGTLDIERGNGSSSGTFTAANAARVNVSGTLTATLDAAAGGVIGLQYATLNTGTRCIGAGKSLAFNGVVTVNGTVTTGQAGGPGTLEIDMREFTYFTGTANGSLASAGSGFYDWKGGDVGTGAGTGASSGEVLNIASSGVFKISDPRNKAFYGATINNSGTVVWLDGGISCVNSPVFNNLSGGVFNAQSDAQWAPNTTTIFRNKAGAVFNKSGAGTTSTFQSVDFSNAGTVNGLSGTLDIIQGDGSSGGLFTAASGARVNVSGTLTATLDAAAGGVIGLQYATLNTGTRCIGAGKSLAFNGVVTVNGTVTTGEVGGLGTLEIDMREFTYFTGTANGSLASAGSGFYDWKGGDVGTGAGTGASSGEVLNIASSGVFKISDPRNKAFYGATINNSGTVVWLDGGISCVNSPVFNNLSGGVFNAQSDAQWSPNTTTIFRNKAGAVFNKSGAGTTSTFQSVDFSNAGTVKAISGTLDVSGNAFTQTAGATILNGGALSVGAGLALQGGTLSGNGTVTGAINNTGGAVSPGVSAPGALSETGNYTQGAGGELLIQLNGATPLTQYDQLNVNGTVALSGALTLSAGFAPAAGSSFTLINNDGTDAVTGIFAGAPEGASVQAGNALFRISYSGGDGNDVAITTIKPTLVIGDATVVEGNSGTRNMVFSVTLSEALSQPVTVDYFTSDNTAVSPGDYLAAPTTTLTFSPGQTLKKIVVLIQGDTIDEENETFFVTLKNSNSAPIANSRGVGTITDDDAEPTLSIADALTVDEGNSGTVNASFAVTLSAPSGKTVTVHYATADGTAIAPGDYAAKTGTLTFNPGETSKTILVAVKGDLLDEGPENFAVNLSNPINASLADSSGVGIIRDDDGPAVIINNPTSVSEGNSGTASAIFTITLSSPSPQIVTVQFATADFTATAGADYTAQFGTVSFAPGETSKNIVVPITGDTVIEGNETFLMNLFNPVNCNIADGQGAVYILDDDGAALLFDEPSE